MSQVGDETDEVCTVVTDSGCVFCQCVQCVGVCGVQHRPHLLELLKQSKGVRKKQLSEEIERATGRAPNTKLLTVLLRVRGEGEGEGEGEGRG